MERSPAPPPASSLLTRLQRRDPDALGELWSEVQPRLRSYLLRLSGERQVAEDICAETWCRAIDRIDAVRDEPMLRPWLFTIARNLFLSYCRWRKRDEGYLGELTRIRLAAAVQAHPAVEREQAERVERLQLELQALPLKYREVVILVGIEGLSHGEAAQICAILPAVSRQRYRRAIALLRRRCAESGAGDWLQEENHE